MLKLPGFCLNAKCSWDGAKHCWKIENQNIFPFNPNFHSMRMSITCSTKFTSKFRSLCNLLLSPIFKRNHSPYDLLNLDLLNLDTPFSAYNMVSYIICITFDHRPCLSITIMFAKSICSVKFSIYFT